MSGLQKNVASQKWRVFAFNTTTGVAVTGDAANITAKIAKDWGTATASNDTNPTEVEDGYYLFDLTQAESNADVLDFYPESSTANVQVIGTPGTIFNVAENFQALGIETDGDLTKVNTLDGHTPQTADHTTGIADIPTVTEFEARTLLAASYFDPAADTVANVTTVATLTGHTPQTADHAAAIADIPTVAEFNARTLAAAAYFDPAADTVANVTTVATLTGHTAQSADNNTLLVAISGYLDTEIAAILANTNELQTDWANGGRLDVILDARSSQATADAIETNTQDIQSRLPAALVTGRMSSDAVAISGSTDAADKLEESAETMILAQATGGTTTTITTTDITEATADHLNGRIVIFRDGTLSKQATDITDYSFSGGTATLTVTALTEAPTTENFIVV